MSETPKMPLVKLNIIIPKSLNVTIDDSRPLPLLKNTELKDMRWIDLIQRQNPPVFEALSRRAEYIQLYKIAFHMMDAPMKFEMLESTVGNFFDKYKQPPPSEIYVAALVKMPVSEATKEKVVAIIKSMYESLLPPTPGSSTQGTGIQTPAPTLCPTPFLPPPLPTRTRRNPPPLDVQGLRPELPNVTLTHDSFSFAPTVDNFQNDQ